MSHATPVSEEATSARPALDEALSALRAGAKGWSRTSIAERLEVLEQIREGIFGVAEAWATAAAEAKQIPADSPHVGEEWVSGPYAVLSACNGLTETLSKMEGRAYLDELPTRARPDGQVIVRVTPHAIWDHLLLSGVEAEIWMEPEVTRGNLRAHTASAYDTAPEDRDAGVALVLGAGNIAAIAPLDCFQKLFVEHRVVLLKMNPVNDYLLPFLERGLAPLIERDALRIVRGDGAAGAYLCEHHEVDEIHITGARSTHDLIVWGRGQEAERNREAGTPKLHKGITSELGAVCPTIVVPGPWNDADLRFQAEQIATQKLHNSGFNCVAMQVLVVPDGWEHTETLLGYVEDVMAELPPRGLYYPGTEERLAAFAEHTHDVRELTRPGSRACLMASATDPGGHLEQEEVFGPAFGTKRLPNGDPATYLAEAIRFANTELDGTLGANLLIHPNTLSAMGEATFEDLLADLHYGAIAINAWTGLAFLMTACPWGAFPGHTLEDVGSGIGFVHNTWMFDKPQRAVVRAPFRPFPRTALSGGLTLLPRPPWFVTNKQGAPLGRLLTGFQYEPGWLKIPPIFAHALLG